MCHRRALLDDPPDVPVFDFVPRVHELVGLSSFPITEIPHPRAVEGENLPKRKISSAG
jgi:hypothetical protein